MDPVQSSNYTQPPKPSLPKFPNIFGNLKADPIFKLVTKVLMTLFLIGLVLSLFSLKENVLDKSTLITVTGEGSVKADPNIAKLKVAFSNTASSSEQALSGNAGLAKVLVQILESQGLKRQDISVFSATLTPIQQTSGGFQYRADNDAQITLSKVTDYKKVINALFAANYTNISSVVFTSTNAKELEKQALDLAIKDAKEKGMQIAKSSGKRLGKIISISTQDSQTAEKSIGEATADDVSAPAKIEIKKTAAVIYELK